MKKIIATVVLITGLAIPIFAQGPGSIHAQEIYSSTGQVQIDGLADKGGQVFNVKAYGAKGDGLTDDTTAIQNTINAMPSCTQAGQTWTHCGEVYFPNGAYKVSSTLTLSSPFIRLVGTSNGSVKILSYITSGCTITWTANPFNAGQDDTNSGGMFNITIDGTNTTAGTCGLETYDLGGFNAQALSISNFSGTGSAGWWDNAITEFNERFHVQINLANNATDWLVQNSHTAGTGNTFGYGTFDVSMNCNAGQTCWKLTGQASPYQVQLDNSLVHIIENTVGSSTGISLTQSLLQGNVGIIHIENASGCTAGETELSVGAGSTFNPEGRFDQDCSSTNVITGSFNPGMYSAFGTDYKFVPSGGLVMDAGGITAIYGGNLSLSTGGSCLNLWGSSSGNNNLCPPSTINGGWTLPSPGGTLLISGTNGISAGTIALSGGTGSHTFATAYSTTPVCTATDQTSAAAVKATATTTTISLAGTGTDTIAWICAPAAN